jgi:hypothetical protein
MSASEAPIQRLLFVADAGVAEVHDLPAEAREDFKSDHMLLALRSSDHANWQERGLEERPEKRLGLPLLSYAVDPRGHATGAQHP